MAEFIKRIRNHRRAIAAVATARRHPWAAFVVIAALLVIPAAVWARLQQGSPWPMFQRDTQHSGRSGLRGPDSWEVRWYYQTGDSITASPALTDNDGARRCYFLRWEDGPEPNDSTPALLMSPTGPAYTDTAQLLPLIHVGEGKSKLVTWVTADDDPGESSVPVGDWRFVLNASSSDDDSATLFFKVYGLESTGEKGDLLFETGQTDALTTTGATVEVLHTVTESIDTATYERLLVEVWADTAKDTDIRIALLMWPYVALIETSYAKPALFVGSTDGRFYALSQADGKLLWSQDTGAAIDSPAAIDDYGTIYVGNSAGLLYAFNLAGRVEWVYGDDPTLVEPPDEPIVGIVGGPTISDDGVIYITTESGMLQAIDPADGGLLWTWPGESDQEVPLDYPILTSPAIGSEGTIYITRYDGFLYAISFEGETLWSFEVPEEKEDGQPYPIQSSPTVVSYNLGTADAPKVGDLVLFGSHSGHLYAVHQDEDAPTQGALLWDFSGGGGGVGPITSTPAIYIDRRTDPHNPTTYAWFGAANGRVYKVDVSTGTEDLNRITTDDIPVRSSACIDLRVGDENADGYVYIGANDGKVYAWELDGSSPGNWPFNPRAIAGWGAMYVSAYPFVSSPCLGKDTDPELPTGDNELLFIGGLDGLIYCLGPGAGGAPEPPAEELPELRPRLSVNKQRDYRAAWIGDIITYTLWINNRGEVPAIITDLTDEIVDKDLRQYVKLASDEHGNWNSAVWRQWGDCEHYPYDCYWSWKTDEYPLAVDARETITVVLKIELKDSLSKRDPKFDTRIQIHDNPNLDPADPEGRPWEPHSSDDPNDPGGLIFPGDNGRNEFDWGQHLCLDVRGVGNSERLRNRATAYFTGPEGGEPYKMDSNIALTSLGWMNRWLLMLRYEEELPDGRSAPYDPAPGYEGPRAQAPTHYVLMDSRQASGRRARGSATFQWWNDKTDENDKHVLLIKVYLDPTVSPRTSPIEKIEELGPGDPIPMDVAKQRNRPWVPYCYTVRVVQAKAKTLPDYGQPPPRPDQPMPAALDPRKNAEWDPRPWELDDVVIIHNPFDVLDEIGKDSLGNPIHESMSRVNIGGTDPADPDGVLPVPFNPGSSTGNTRVTIKNRTRGLPFQDGSGIRPGWPMTPRRGGGSSGRTTRGRRPDLRNVVRWTEVDLLYALGWVNFGADYDLYRENTIGQDMIRIGPAAFFEIGPSEMATMMVAADLPKYLHPGLYRAPGGWDGYANIKSGDQYRIYVDLNGNETWDPGETFFQNEPTDFEPNKQDQFSGQYDPLTLQVQVAEQPLLRIDEDTIDLGKVPAGAAAPHWALLTLRNPGNTKLSDPQYEIGSSVGFSAAGEQRLVPYLEPSWLVTDWLALNLTQPLSTEFIPVPVAGESLEIDGHRRPVTDKTPVGASAPAGTPYLIYDEAKKLPVGQPVGTYVGKTTWRADGLRPDGRPSLIEARDSATIKTTVVESRLADGAGIGAGSDIIPTACPDPTGATMDVVWSSNTGDTHEPPWYRLYCDSYDFNTRQWNGSSAVGTAIAPYETGVSGLAYLYPSLTTGSDGARWLAWSGSAWRDIGGTLYSDNRVFLQPWAASNTVAFPALTQPLGSQEAVVSPQAWIQPVYDGQGELDKRGVLIWSRGAGESWALRYSYAADDPAQQASWRADQPLYTSSGLTYSRDPLILSPVQLTMLPESERALIHVLFTGFSPYFGNADIYYARYHPLLLEDPFHNNGQQPFAPVPRETLSRDPDDSRLFYTRHKEWWIDWYADQQHKELDPPVVHFNETDWVPDPDNKVYDREAGLVTWTVGNYTIQYSPSLGQIRFLPSAPSSTVQLTYTPCLLRLTDSRSGDAGPVGLIEWPRYRTEFGEPQPLDPANLWIVRPRLWLFWRRTAAQGLPPRLYYKTFRHYIQSASASPVDENVTIPERLVWLEEIRSNTTLWKAAWQEYDPTLNLTEVWSLDVPDSAVPADVQIEDTGIAAAKDPSTSSIWLFWSSLRTPLEGDPAQASNDIFYQAFNPPMPDALTMPQQ